MDAMYKESRLPTVTSRNFQTLLEACIYLAQASWGGGTTVSDEQLLQISEAMSGATFAHKAVALDIGKRLGEPMRKLLDAYSGSSTGHAAFRH